MADSRTQLAKSEDRLEALRTEATTLRSERDIEHTKRVNLEEQLATIKSEAKESLEKQAASLQESCNREIQLFAIFGYSSPCHLGNMEHCSMDDLGRLADQLLKSLETLSIFSCDLCCVVLFV